MSSHHIIRDNQEPALILLEIENFPVGRLQQLLGWSPVIVVTSESLEFAHSMGIKIDKVILTNDQARSFRGILDEQFPIELISFEAKQDLLIQALGSIDNTTVNVVVSDATSVEMLASSAAIKHIQITLHDKTCTTHIIHGLTYFKWLSRGQKLMVHPMNRGSWFSTEGFEVDLDQEISEPNSLTCRSEGKVFIQANSGPFAVTEFY